MFEQSLVHTGQSRAPQALLLSAVIQSAAISAAVILPLLRVAGIGAPRTPAAPLSFALQPVPAPARPPATTTVFHTLLALPNSPALPPLPALVSQRFAAPTTPAEPSSLALAGFESYSRLPPASIAAPIPPPPPPVPAGVNVGGAIQAARCLYCPAPLYPYIAKQLHIEGTVRFRARIAADGTIVSLVPERGNSILAAAARRAILRWRYRPLLLNGAPVALDTEITVHFTLDR
jgi:protein TonB